MTAIDWTPILQAIIGVCAMVITALTAKYLPRAIAAYEQISGIQLNAQQRVAIYHAADTAANLLVGQVEQGLLPLAAATDPNHPAVASHAADALVRIPTVANEQKVTPIAMQQIVAGKVAATSSYITVPPVPPVTVTVSEMPEPVVGGRPDGGPDVGAPFQTSPWKGPTT